MRYWKKRHIRTFVSRKIQKILNYYKKNGLKNAGFVEELLNQQSVIGYVKKLGNQTYIEKKIKFSKPTVVQQVDSGIGTK